MCVSSQSLTLAPPSRSCIMLGPVPPGFTEKAEAKFADPSLREKLLRTGERELIDGHSGSPDLILGRPLVCFVAPISSYWVKKILSKTVFQKVSTADP